jgi:ABC-type phosphate transport system substrate-binding protein
VLATAAVGLTSLIVGNDPASADPKQLTTLFVGVGSDTTQDILNALAGEANGNNYTPVQSSAATGKKQLTSWDATGAGCITPRAPGATFTRPNGSTNGRRALSRSLDGTPWVGAAPCANKVVSGLVDFARSSAGPSGAGTVLTYIPFGRDALGFAYFANPGTTPVTTLTTAQLQTLFTSGPQTIGGIEIIPCGIQLGSGTNQSWTEKMTGLPGSGGDATMTAATSTCGARLQENDAAGLATRGATFPGKQLVIGFSAANFISQNNGVAASQLAAGVDMGAIDALGKPYTGTVGTPPIAPSATFYADTFYGRDVYNVLPTSKVGGLPAANADYKSMFVGSGSAVCSASSTISAFGFLPLGAACGSTTLQGPSVS